MLIHRSSCPVTLCRGGVELLTVSAEQTWKTCCTDLAHPPPDQEAVVQSIKLLTLWQLV